MYYCVHLCPVSFSLSVGSASPNHGYPCSMGESGQKSVFYLEGEEMGPERARALLTATQPIASKSKFGISQRLGVLSLAQVLMSLLIVHLLSGKTLWKPSPPSTHPLSPLIC